jgi:pyruvate dehydrogenase kinase 2/3/4
VLAEQHIALSANFDGAPVVHPRLIGIVDSKVNAREIVHTCTQEVSVWFMENFEDSPSPSVMIDGELGARFTYIPEHIKFIISELLKNSMKSTYQEHKGRTILPPIRVTIGVAPNQIMFRVSDRGYFLGD